MTGSLPSSTTDFHVPDSLAELDQWVLWRYEWRDGDKKVPDQISGSPASSTDPKTWCSFDEALNAWRADSSTWSGIGFVFSPDDPFFGTDLDHCLDPAGKLKAWAKPIMERFFDSYAEISPSGLGIKIWAQGRLPGGGTAVPIGDGRVEIYDCGRYFTVTGNPCWPDARYRGAPSRPRLAARSLPSRPQEGALYC